LAAPPAVAPAAAPSGAVTDTAHFATRAESVASGSRQQKDERAVARGDGAVLHLLPDGATFFRFDTDAKQPSAAELAWQRLAAQLPAQAVAGLAARVGRMQQLSGETYVSKSDSASASMPVSSLPAAAQANAMGSFPAAGARWLKVKRAEMQGQATAHTARSRSLDVTQRGSLPGECSAERGPARGLPTQAVPGPACGSCLKMPGCLCDQHSRCHPANGSPVFKNTIFENTAVLLSWRQLCECCACRHPLTRTALLLLQSRRPGWSASLCWALPLLCGPCLVGPLLRPPLCASVQPLPTAWHQA
jgi:hypothetical protein